MSTYKSLPIYTAIYNLLMQIMEISHHLPKEYKYTIGEKLQNEGLEMVLCVYRANSMKNRSEHLLILKDHIQLIYLLLRIGHDLKIIPLEKYTKIVELTDTVSQQAHGWYKSSEKMRESV